LHYAKNSESLEASSFAEFSIADGNFSLSIPYEGIDDYLTWKLELIDAEGGSTFYENTQGESVFKLERDEIRVVYTWNAENPGNWSDVNNWVADIPANYGYPGTVGNAGYYHSSIFFNSNAEVDLQGGQYCLTDNAGAFVFAPNINVIIKNGVLGLNSHGITVGSSGTTVEYRDLKLSVKTTGDDFFNLSFAGGSTNIFTGSIDAYFDYQYGHLSYRTVRFETEIHDTPNHQGNAVINYTEATVPYTRVIEHKHFETFGADVYANPKTVVSKEYSCEWKEGMEPYYPVNDAQNTALYQQYAQLAALEKNVIFGGRLAEYKYYDMDDIIEQALYVQL
jgi:hypothetical protein